MVLRPRPLFARAALLLGGAALLLACVQSAATKKKSTPIDPGDEFGYDDSPQEEPIATTVDPDSGAFGAAARPANPTKDAGQPTQDGGPVVTDGGAGDGGVVTRTYCAGPLAAGDLAITELLIASRSGANDDGEWIEIQSTRSCWLRLAGVTIESPRGVTSTNVATITESFDLAPNGTFLVADSIDPTKNHALPGKVFAWTTTDVLKNDGDTVTVKMGATVLETLTYPAFSNLVPARSVAFPADCAASARSDWQRWSLTFSSWTTGFEGTPNAPNLDVTCF